MAGLKERATSAAIAAREAVKAPGAMLLPANVRGLVVEMAAILEGLAFAIEEMKGESNDTTAGN